MVEKLKHDRLEMVQARIAAALLSPSQHISLPFNDFLGMEARINNPEEARVDNWTLRVPENYAKCYENALEQNAAANIPKALAMAIGARIRRGDLDASAAPSTTTGISRRRALPKPAMPSAKLISRHSMPTWSRNWRGISLPTIPPTRQRRRLRRQTGRIWRIRLDSAIQNRNNAVGFSDSACSWVTMTKATRSSRLISRSSR